VSKKAEEVFVINEAAWSKRLAQFKAVITEQQNIITQAEQAIESVAQSFKDNVLGQIKFGLTDKDGNALTPEQIVSAIFGDITKQKEVVNQIATNIGTALPPELLNQILAMPPDTAIALAKYLGEHPEMLAQLTTDYEALGTFTYTTLGVPMGKAWAKIGNESASTMIVQAKKVIDEEAADFKAWVKSKLATTVVVKVRYEAENNPNDVLKSIGSYEAANGTSWRT
jgi:plasmid maintenance system antidote protein VapI